MICVICGSALAFLNEQAPFAAIEYNAAEAVALHGSAEQFSKTAPILLKDLSPSDATNWLASSVSSLTTLRGYAHVGSDDATQVTADSWVAAIQIWGWLDTNGNGAADSGDTTTQWMKLTELKPSQGQGHAIGWNIAYPDPAIKTSTWRGDVLQGQTIPLKPGQSWLLLIRVVDISGNTSLMTQVQGLEQWDNGSVDGVGSDMIADRFVDSNGNTPGQIDARIQDDDVVWVYVPRLK